RRRRRGSGQDEDASGRGLSEGKSPAYLSRAAPGAKFLAPGRAKREKGPEKQALSCWSLPPLGIGFLHSAAATASGTKLRGALRSRLAFTASIRVFLSPAFCLRASRARSRP